METNQKITYGAIGILTLLIAALGGTIYLTPDQLDHAYICTANQNVVIADHLSSTQKTAYWFDDLNVSKSKTCTNGIWTSLKQYAKDNNLEINVLLQNVNSDSTSSASNVAESGKSYTCDQTGCKEKL